MPIFQTFRLLSVAGPRLALALTDNVRNVSGGGDFRRMVGTGRVLTLASVADLRRYWSVVGFEHGNGHVQMHNV